MARSKARNAARRRQHRTDVCNLLRLPARRRVLCAKRITLGSRVTPHCRIILEDDGRALPRLPRRSPEALPQTARHRDSARGSISPGMSRWPKSNGGLRRHRAAWQKRRVVLGGMCDKSHIGIGLAHGLVEPRWTELQLIPPHRYSPVALRCHLLNQLTAGLEARLVSSAKRNPRDVGLSSSGGPRGEAAAHPGWCERPVSGHSASEGRTLHGERDRANDGSPLPRSYDVVVVSNWHKGSAWHKVNRVHGWDVPTLVFQELFNRLARLALRPTQGSCQRHIRQQAVQPLAGKDWLAGFGVRRPLLFLQEVADLKRRLKDKMLRHVAGNQPQLGQGVLIAAETLPHLLRELACARKRKQNRTGGQESGAASDLVQKPVALGAVGNATCHRCSPVPGRNRLRLLCRGRTYTWRGTRVREHPQLRGCGSYPPFPWRLQGVHFRG